MRVAIRSFLMGVSLLSNGGILACADDRGAIAVSTSPDSETGSGTTETESLSTDGGASTTLDSGTGSGATETESLSTDGCLSLSGSVTSLSKGTYCVVGDVIVPAGTVLSIPAGTTFIFMGRHRFGRDPALPDTTTAVSGTIWAIGSEAEPILFRGVTPDIGWYGIVVSNSPEKVHFEWVTVRDALKDDTDPNSRIWRRGGGLNSYNNTAGTILRHCSFIHNRASSIAGAVAINSHGYWPDAGAIEITDSLFEDNACDCQVYSGTSVDLCGGGAVRVSHVAGSAELVKIQRNVFRDNEAKKTNGIDAYGGAIGGFDSGIIIGPGNSFINNKAATSDGGVSCAGLPQTGLVVEAIDEGVVFQGNTPNNGCGK